MSRNARIEEVSDSESDPDPDDMDPSDFDPTAVIRSSTSSTQAPQPQTEQLVPQNRAPSTSSADRERYKTWNCVYPVYFDATRSRAEGRRVGKALAVENPLAKDIADAVQLAGFNVVFEPAKMHPKDWANPGRIKFNLKENGQLSNPVVKNSGLPLCHAT